MQKITKEVIDANKGLFKSVDGILIASDGQQYTT